jgi:hypothetical protein
VKLSFDPASDTSFIRRQHSCAEAMAKHFKSLRNDVTAKTPWDNIQANLEIAIVYSGQENYRRGAIEVGRTPDATDLLILRKAGVRRAQWVASEMRGWTEASLKASKKSKLLSLSRANKVAVYESRKSAFSGRLKGWSLNKEAKKEWLTSDAHDQDDVCDDNEDDGIIDMDVAFTSSDMAPPAHLYCMCSLWLHL